ncbi:MAG: hypothetical protein HOW97_32930 [Catenulispora sp.]|nr:hypothetical protein [Catenulispora sp.]
MTFNSGQRLKASDLDANMPQLLGSTVLTANAANMPITIPAGYNHLEAIYTARKSVGGGGGFVWLQFNGDNAAHYQWENQIGNGAPGTSGASLVTFIQVGLLAGSSDIAGYFASGRITVGNISSTSAAKTVDATSTLVCSGTTYYKAMFGGVWNQAAAITQVTLIPDAGAFVAGSSLSIYGWG